MPEPGVIIGFIALFAAILLVHWISVGRNRRRLRALDKITNQAKLLRIAKSDLPDNLREAAANKIRDPEIRQEALDGIASYRLRAPMTKSYNPKPKSDEQVNTEIRNSLCPTPPRDSHGGGHHWEFAGTEHDEENEFDVYKCKNCGERYREARVFEHKEM